jgi:hypothetical protein
MKDVESGVRMHGVAMRNEFEWEMDNAKSRKRGHGEIGKQMMKEKNQSGEAT